MLGLGHCRRTRIDIQKINIASTLVGRRFDQRRWLAFPTACGLPDSDELDGIAETISFSSMWPKAWRASASIARTR